MVSACFSLAQKNVKNSNSLELGSKLILANREIKCGRRQNGLGSVFARRSASACRVGGAPEGSVIRLPFFFVANGEKGDK